MLEETHEYYKIIKNSIQFIDVELVDSVCRKIDTLGNSNGQVNLKFSRNVKTIEEGKAIIYMTTYLTGPDELFYIEVTFKGVCKKIDKSISEEIFVKYAKEQIVPLLLPYAREYVSNTLVRMKLPIFLLPTIDILLSMEENNVED